MTTRVQAYENIRDGLFNDLSDIQNKLGDTSLDELRRHCERIIFDIRQYNHLVDYIESRKILAR